MSELLEANSLLNSMLTGNVLIRKEQSLKPPVCHLEYVKFFEKPI